MRNDKLSRKINNTTKRIIRQVLELDATERMSYFNGGPLNVVNQRKEMEKFVKSEIKRLLEDA